jgi:hypothetical protein
MKIISSTIVPSSNSYEEMNAAISKTSKINISSSKSYESNQLSIYTEYRNEEEEYQQRRKEDGGMVVNDERDTVDSNSTSLNEEIEDNVRTCGLFDSNRFNDVTWFGLFSTSKEKKPLYGGEEIVVVQEKEKSSVVKDLSSSRAKKGRELAEEIVSKAEEVAINTVLKPMENIIFPRTLADNDDDTLETDETSTLQSKYSLDSIDTEDS